MRFPSDKRQKQKIVPISHFTQVVLSPTRWRSYRDHRYATSLHSMYRVAQKNKLLYCRCTYLRQLRTNLKKSHC